jgi:hypothetical protein
VLKTCPYCQKIFGPSHGRRIYCSDICEKKGGYLSRKEKALKNAREYYWKNRQKILEYKKAERENQPEKIDARKKEHYEKHKREILRKKQFYYINNKPRIKEYRKGFYETHKVELAVKNRQYRISNSAKIREHIRNKRPEINAYARERHKIPMIKLSRNMKNLVWRSLRGMKNGTKWQEIVNYDVSALRKHLEAQFKPGMSWDNYGSWHIDHKVPISAFFFTSWDDPQFKECWSLGNLQPLWAKENQSKGGANRRAA